MQLLEVVSATLVFGLSATAALQISARGAGAAAHDQDRRQELDRLEATMALVQAQLSRPTLPASAGCNQASAQLQASLGAVTAAEGIRLSSEASNGGEALVVRLSGSRWQRQRLFSGAALGWCQEMSPEEGRP